MFELSTQEQICEEFMGSDRGCDGAGPGQHGRVTAWGWAQGIPLPSTTPTSQPGSIYIPWKVIRGLGRELWKLHVKVHILFLFQGKMGLLSFCLCISKQKALSSDKDC